MKKLMIDMDDVICTGGFLNLVNEFMGTNHKIEDIKFYYMQDVIPKEKLAEWGKFFAKGNMYKNIKPMENCYEVIKKLNNSYEVYILTAYAFKDNMNACGKLLKDKYNWLRENLEFINPERFIFMNNKSILECEIRIDDKLSNLKGKSEKKILFKSYHNASHTEEELQKLGVIKANNWKDIEKILL